MIDTAFYTVLNMSITATFIGFFIMILRRIKYIPRLGVYSLWVLVALRLILPFSVSSRISLMNFTGMLVKRVIRVDNLSSDSIYLSTTNVIGAADTYFPVTYKTEQLRIVFEVASFVWIIGAAGAILTVSILYYLTSRDLKNSLLVKDNIYTSEMVKAPIVHGIIKQRIIIPKDYIDKEEQLQYVLLHESVHIKRHDNLLRLIAVYTACMHWFNPFLWIYIKLFINDMELTCDTRAVKSLSIQARKQYAKTLINVGTRQQLFMSTSFGKANVKARVVNVLTFKKISMLALGVTMIFVLTVAAILLTNPIK